MIGSVLDAFLHVHRPAVGRPEELGRGRPHRQSELSCRRSPTKPCWASSQWTQRWRKPDSNSRSHVSPERDAESISCRLARWRWLVRGAVQSPPPSWWDHEFESSLLQRRVQETSVPSARNSGASCSTNSGDETRALLFPGQMVRLRGYSVRPASQSNAGQISAGDQVRIVSA
jgi:hypothetical protein